MRKISPTCAPSTIAHDAWKFPTMTARAKTTGEAVTFVNETDMNRFAQIEKLIEKEVIKTNKLPKDIGEGPEYKVWEKKNRYSKPKKKYNKKRHR